MLHLSFNIACHTVKSFTMESHGKDKMCYKQVPFLGGIIAIYFYQVLSYSLCTNLFHVRQNCVIGRFDFTDFSVFYFIALNLLFFIKMNFAVCISLNNNFKIILK